MRHTHHQLVLLVPGLCGPDSDPPVSDYLTPRPQALDRLISRSSITPSGHVGLEAALCYWFGLGNTRQAPPVAPLTFPLDTGVNATDYILRADPVHLRTDQSVLRLFDASTFEISQHEADALAATFNQHFSEQGLQLLVPCPQRWYLQLEQAPELSTSTLSSVGGQDIDGWLPQGNAAAHWHGFLNEVQMLFHEHPINVQREQRGEPAINSVWLWGGGAELESIDSHVSCIATDHVFALGLAQQSATPRVDVPDNVNELLPLTSGGVTLLLLDSLAAAAQYGDIERWLKTLRELESHWFKPLLHALTQGTLESLEIDPCNGCRAQLTRRRLRYFWRRERMFEQVCKHD